MKAQRLALNMLVEVNTTITCHLLFLFTDFAVKHNCRGIAAT